MMLTIGLVVLILVGVGVLALRDRRARPVHAPTPSVPGARHAPTTLARPPVRPASEGRILTGTTPGPRPTHGRTAAPAIAQAPTAPASRPAAAVRPTAPTAPARRMPPLPAPRRQIRDTILIVDDSLVMQRSLANLFMGAGYSTAVAEHGEAALDWVAANGMPGLITLDMEMPGRNGVETLRDLYALGGSQPVPAIFITTRQQAGLRETTAPMGVLGYFSKPFIPEDLLVVARRTVQQIAQAGTLSGVL